jgi:RND family efflux transporter MFP subunit
MLAACGGGTARVTERKVTGPVGVARNETLAETRITTGTVRSTNVSPLAAKVMGNVTRVLVREGDRVRAGQLLLEIDDREGRARTAQMSAANMAARANANVMASTYQRVAMLREKGHVSAQDFDEAAAKKSAAEAQLQQARAGLTEAETFLSYANVRSPIDGVVTARMVDPGAQAAPGMPLLTVEDDEHYRVETTIDEELAMRVHAGDVVQIDGKPARITNVVPALDPVTRSALVQIDADRSVRATRSGAFVRVAFPIGARNGITVPAKAVQYRGQLTSVLVVDADGNARMRLVTLGESAGDRIEVLSGIDPGERVALQ